MITFQIFKGLNSRWLLQNGDAAGYVDILSPNSGMNTFRFAYGFSTLRLQELLALGPDEITEVGFNNPYSTKPFYQAHPYLIGYVIRLIKIPLFQIETVPLILLAISYSMGVMTLTMFGVKKNIQPIKIFLLLSVIVTSVIFIGSLRGQPYIDRLTFGPFIVIFLRLTESQSLTKRKWIELYGLAVFCILLSERAALMVGVLIIMVTLLTIKYKQTIDLHHKVVILFGILGIGWYQFWASKISANRDVANNTSLKLLWSNLKTFLIGDRQQQAIIFLLALVPFFLFVVFLNRYFLVFLLFILPNVLVSIGGAELSGFSTHYHAMYLPIAAAVILLAVVSLKELPRKSWRNQLVLPVIVLALSSNLTMNSVNKYSLSNITDNLGQLADSFGFIRPDMQVIRAATKIEYLAIFELIEPKSSVLSMPEGFMPAGVHSGFTRIDYFPVGIGQSEYLLVPFIDSEYSQVEFSLFGLVPEKNRAKWSSAILNEINKSYVEFAKYNGTYGFISVYKMIV